MEAIALLFGILTWVVWSAMNGEIAKEKGRRGWTIVLFSFIFSPFLGYLYILAVPDKKKE